MKLFLVAAALPANQDDSAAKTRIRSCIEPIADLIMKHIQDDPALFAMGHEGFEPANGLMFENSTWQERATQITSRDLLRETLMDCGDPDSGRWVLIRSLITCRAVSYGFDGQAFVCLQMDDEPMISPDDTKIVVEECSHLLVETDCLDGLTRHLGPSIVQS